MKNKGLIIGLSVVGLLILIIIIVVVSKRGSSSTDEAQAALNAMQDQANDPSTPPAEKDSLLNQITKLATVIQQIKTGKGASTGATPIGMGWTPLSSSTGICTSPAALNKTLVLKMGSKSGEVCALQSYLNTKGAGLVNDGIFGAKTQTALKNTTGKTSITLGEIITV